MKTEKLAFKKNQFQYKIKKVSSEIKKKRKNYVLHFIRKTATQ